MVLFGACHRHGGGVRAEPLLGTPELALEALSGKPLYFNGPARPFVLARRGDLVTAEDKEEGSPRTRSFVEAVQDAKLFRQLDRQYHFATVFLAGDPSECRPLLDYLLDSKEWTLSYLDHTSLIFRRGDEDPWTEAKLDAVRARFASMSADARASFLAGAAVKLIAVRKGAQGKKLADEAAQLAPDRPDGLAALAYFHLDRGEWEAAISEANRALDRDAGCLAALATKAQALYSTKHFEEAFRVSDKLIQKASNDPALLFYHAKICHEARAFAEEEKALLRLIALAEQNKRTTSGYRVYLGQAYAREGKGAQALEQYGKALADPELPREKREDVEKTMTVVKTRMAGGE